LGKLDFCPTLPVHVNPLVVVVDRHGEFLLGLLLPDDVLVEEGLHLDWLGKLVGGGCGLRFRAVVLQNGVADGNALIANVGSRVVGGRRDQLGNSVLRLVAKRTAQYFVGTSSGPHGKTPLPRTLSAGTLRFRATFPVPSKRAGAVCPCKKSTPIGHGQPSCDPIRCYCTYPYSTTIRRATRHLVPDWIQLSKHCRANSSHEAR